MKNLILECKKDYPYKLILIVGKNNAEMKKALDEGEKEKIEEIDIGKELSEYYIYERKRFSGSITEMWMKARVDSSQNIILLENTEILFSKNMNLDVIKLLQNISKNRVVIAEINGKIENGKLYVGNKYDIDYKIYDISDVKRTVVI